LTSSNQVKLKAKDLGLHLVGITKAENVRETYVDQRSPSVPSWVDSVIVLGLHLWDELMDANINRETPQEVEYFEVYEEILQNRARMLCEYLREEGSRAEVNQYQISLKKAAEQSGLGIYGKSGLILNPVFGADVRLTAVMTDARLEADKPFDKDLCGACEACIRACPLQAIVAPFMVDRLRCINAIPPPTPKGIPQETYKAAEKIMKYPSRHSVIGCNICVDVCPIGK